MNENLTYLELPASVDDGCLNNQYILRNTYYSSATANAAMKTIVAHCDEKNFSYTVGGSNQYENYTIYGKKGTKLEAFAKEKGLTFYDIDTADLPKKPEPFVPTIEEEVTIQRDLQVEMVGNKGYYEYYNDHSLEIQNSGPIM